MKIALVGRFGEGKILSGPEKVAKNLFNEISLTNKDTVFLSYFFKTEKTRNFKTLLFGFQKLSSDRRVYRLGLFRLILELYKIRPSIIHLVTFERFTIGVFLLKPLLKYKIVYTVHGIYKFEQTIFINKPTFISKLKDLTLERLIFKKSDVLVFLSQKMIELAKNYYEVNSSDSLIIPNGVLVHDNYESRNFNLNHRLEVLFYNGLENSRKRGLEDLLIIFSDKRLKNYHLTVIGNSISTSSDDISLIQPLPEKAIYEFLRDKHILIDNLGYMPFSIFAMEAMALGMVILVSDQSGIASFIKNGINGFVYKETQPEQITDILVEILEAKHKLKELSREAYLTARDLSWNKIAAQYLQAYRELLA
ncbi:MAG: glycosyltransferase family 4 protein [Ignavibacteriaceae bacterium]|nr:glycosyltransferase family 4 protein [Ignavibacteriaceae bacterium]